MNIKKQIIRLNLFGFSACLRIPDAVWVVLLTARGYSLWQIGLAESIFHIVSLLGEIPSGMAADLLGRRRTLAAAGLAGVISALTMALSTDFPGICISMAFSALSWNLISGSDEALLYDSLLQADCETEYLRINARYTQVQTLGSICSNAASLLAGLLSYVGIYLLDAVVCLFRTLTALSLTEPTVTQAQAMRQEHPFRDLGRRFREHVAAVADFLRSCPHATVIMLAEALITLPSYLTLMFLQQRLSELGLSAMWLGIPIMCISLSRMAGIFVGERLHPRGLRELYIVCALLTGVGTTFAGTASILLAVFGAMLAAGSMDACVLHTQKHLNNVFPSDRRATLVSADMMAYSLLMIFTSPLLGWLSDVTGSAGAGLCVLGAIVAVAGIAVSFAKSK